MASDNSASMAEVFAICIKEVADSIIRAPPDFEMTTKGIFFSKACLAARVIFSPTTEPMEPPIKAKSMQATTKASPIDFPTAMRIASLRLVFLWAAFRRSLYFLVSSNFKKSLERRSASSSSNSLSSKSI